MWETRVVQKKTRGLHNIFITKRPTDIRCLCHTRIHHKPYHTALSDSPARSRTHLSTFTPILSRCQKAKSEHEACQNIDGPLPPLELCKHKSPWAGCRNKELSTRSHGRFTCWGGRGWETMNVCTMQLNKKLWHRCNRARFEVVYIIQ